MRFPLLFCFFMFFYCISDVNLHANDKQAFKPDLSKNNIKKVHVHRVNCYDYEGDGSNRIEQSNRGMLIAELHNPKDCWVVYKFDLSPIINEDNITEGIKHKKIVKPESEEDSLIIYGKDTLDYHHSFKDTCYNIKIRLIDTLSFLHYISDTIFTSGYGKLPDIVSFTTYKSDYFLIQDNIVRYWEDSGYFNYYLSDQFLESFNSQYNLVLLPANNNDGNIVIRNINGFEYPSPEECTNIIIKDVIVNELRKFTKNEFSYLYPDNTISYDDFESRFSRTGFLIIRDNFGDIWFVSGVDCFKLDTSFRINQINTTFTSMGVGFILTNEKKGNYFHTYFSKKYPKGKFLCSGRLKLGIRGFIIPGDYIKIPTYYDYLCMYIDDRVNIFNFDSADYIPVEKGWKLMKDFGWIQYNSPILNTKYERYFKEREEYFLDNLVYLTSKNKVMIFENGEFYELTKKKMKEMGW